MAGFNNRGRAGRRTSGVVWGVAAVGFWVLLFSVIGNALQGLHEVWRWLVSFLLIVTIPIVGYCLIIGVALLYGVVTGKKIDFR